MFNIKYYILLPEQLPDFLATLAINEKVINCELEESKLRIQTESTGENYEIN